MAKRPVHEMTKKIKAKLRRPSERRQTLDMLESLAVPDTFWPKLAKELRHDKSRLFYGWGQSAVPGVKLIEAVHPDCCCPLGTVWFRWISPAQIDILYSYVRPGVRRCGLRTYLHQQLLRVWPDARITTNSGTLDGIGWMQSAGFEYRKPGEWVFERETCPPNKPTPGRRTRNAKSRR